MTINGRFLIGVVVAALALALPLVVSSAWQGVMTKMLIAALFASGFNLLLGQAGLLSFGHAAFYGIGAIATMHAMIASEHGVFYIPLPLLPLVGAGAGLLLALIAGCFATKRSGTYFALVTLAMAELIHVIAPMWQSVFGGEAGLTSMRMPSLGVSFASTLDVYMLTLFWTALGIWFLWLLSLSAFGQLTLALKGNEQRLKFLGFDTYKGKVLTFAISGMIAGLAGSLLSISNETANYTLFSVMVSTEVVFFTFIGGSAFFLGPAIAAAVLTAIPHEVSNYTHAWPLYQGLFFMVVMLTVPDGLGGLLRDQTSARHKAETVRRTRRFVIGLGIIGVIAAFLETGTRLRRSGVVDLSAEFWIWILIAVLGVFVSGCLLRWRFADRDRDIDKSIAATSGAVQSKRCGMQRILRS
jgi:branched-chain amino acid transport system permease protein